MQVFSLKLNTEPETVE